MMYINTDAVVVSLNKINIIYFINLFTIINILLNQTFYAESLNFNNFVIYVSVSLVIFLNYIYDLLRMMSYLWFHFLYCCTQTISLTTIVFSCSDSYWCSVSNMFLLFNLFICFVHSSANNTLLTSFFLFWVLLWAFFKIYLWTVYLCWW